MTFDDELRQRMQQAAADAGKDADPTGVAEVVSSRAAGAGAAATLKLAGGIGAAGLVLGGLLGLTALRPPTDEVNADTAGGVNVIGYAATDCPDGVPVRTLRAGDRVYVVGRTDSSEWVAVRDPSDVGTPIWLPESAIDPDEAIDAPILSCDTGGASTGLAVAESSTTTSSTTTSSTSTTTTSSTAPSITDPTAPPTTRPGPVGPVPTPAPPVNTPDPPVNTPAPPVNTPAPPQQTMPPAPTTTSPPPPAPTTTSPPPAPTTMPPDTTKPSIGQAGASPSVIYTISAGVTDCGQSATVTVVANDNVGVVAVTGTYNGGSFGLGKSGGNTWSGTFGPFQSAPPGPPQKSITLTARDAAGNTASTSVSVTVFGCPF